jgi:deoxyribodipyrimidine photolyase
MSTSRAELRRQRLQMIVNWQQSGLSQKEYCREHQIAYPVFHYWYKAWRKAQPMAPGTFTPVEVEAPLQGHTELLLADGRRLIFHQVVDAAYLKALLY